MDETIIGRLFASFTDLEKAIHSAKETLAARSELKGPIIDRLRSYDGILAKQRGLANELCGLMAEGDWEKVARHVNLINSLSAMIRDDAKAILQSLSKDEVELEVDVDSLVC